MTQWHSWFDNWEFSSFKLSRKAQQRSQESFAIINSLWFWGSHTLNFGPIATRNLMCHTHVYYISSLICLFSAEMFVERDKFLKHFKIMWLWRRVKQRLQESSTIHMRSPRGRKSANKKLYSLTKEAIQNLCGHSKLMLGALAATESRSLLPVSKTFYIYSITFLVPALMLMWLCCELE